MSELVVLDFDGIGTADEVLTKLRGLQKEHLIDLEDACVVVHTDTGKVQIKQAINLASVGAASGASTGMLIGALAGLLMLNPLAGMAVGGLAGAGFGALSGRMADYGINVNSSRTGHDNPQGLFRLVLADKAPHPGQGLAGNRALQTARAQDIAVKRAGRQTPIRTPCRGSSIRTALRRRDRSDAGPLHPLRR